MKIKTEIERILNAAGIAVGHENCTYSVVERVQNLAASKDYWFRQTDKARAKAELFLNSLRFIADATDMDANGLQECARSALHNHPITYCWRELLEACKITAKFCEDITGDNPEISLEEIADLRERCLAAIAKAKRKRESHTSRKPTSMNKTKATKAQARACYDNYFGILRCLNGGTREENERSSDACRTELEKYVAEAKSLSSNPGKLLAADAWLMRALTEDIPNNFAAFCRHYPMNQLQEAQ